MLGDIDVIYSENAVEHNIALFPIRIIVNIAALPFPIINVERTAYTYVHLFIIVESSNVIFDYVCPKCFRYHSKESLWWIKKIMENQCKVICFTLDKWTSAIVVRTMMAQQSRSTLFQVHAVAYKLNCWSDKARQRGSGCPLISNYLMPFYHLLNKKKKLLDLAHLKHSNHRHIDIRVEVIISLIACLIRSQQ